MSDPETQTQPLIGGPSQTAVNVGAPEQGRSSRAYKVAGITLLACVLIVGQAMTAYFLLTQRNDIKSLQEQGNQLKTSFSKGRSVSVPLRMHMPMNTLSELMDDTAEEKSGTDTPAKFDPSQATDCQLEARGLKPVPVPGFYPACDVRGLYKTQQCYMGQCWCVEPVSGRLYLRLTKLQILPHTC
uniref:Thyroglobulin type-1 domain-containing protein n=1 Tax=Acanthochromis polyacanthus TaxID=80966 RepID=A0A3Q1F8N9_9TELE